MDNWIKEVSGLLSKEVNKTTLNIGPFYAAAEQYVIQSRAASDKTDKIVKDAYHNIEDFECYKWGVPRDTQFAIGGKTALLPSGATGFYGTETTTVRITDDTLVDALKGLEQIEGRTRAARAGGCPNRGQAEGIGQQPEISAAVTILDGNHIRLKLKVGRAVYEIQTYLTASSPKS